MKPIIDQIRIAFHRKNALPTTIGTVLGAFAPVASYVIVHSEGIPSYASPQAAIVAGGLVFSAITVCRWGREVFGGWCKAVPFAVLIECTMLVSTTAWLSAVALALLIGINGVANGTSLAMQATPKRAARKSRKAQPKSRVKVTALRAA